MAPHYNEQQNTVMSPHPPTTWQHKAYPASRVTSHGHHELERRLNTALLVGGLAAGAVVLAPVVLPALGIGEATEEALAEECCNIVGINTGIAGTLSQAIDELPASDYWNTAGGENIFLPAAVILGGHTAGNALENYTQNQGRPSNWGAALRLSSMVLGIALALPALLPGIGHGIQFLARLGGVEEAGNEMAKLLGNTSTCMSSATENGLAAGTPVLLSHLPCVAPALLASAPIISSAALTEVEQPAAPALSKKPLLPHDRNAKVTREEKLLVEIYYASPESTKPLLQQWLSAQGYTPDYHPDGTVHLYQHPPEHHLARR